MLSWVKALTGAGAWWLVAAAVVVGGMGGVAGSRIFYGAQIARLEAKAATERAGVAEERSEGLLEAQGASERASADILGRINRASQVLARESARLPEENQRLKSLLVEVSSHDAFACRRLPLPERLLVGLRRPGSYPAAAAGEDSGAGPGSSVVLPAGTGEPAPELF